MRSHDLKRAIQRFGGRTINKVSVAVIKSGKSLPMLRPETILAIGVRGRRSGTYRLTPMGCVKKNEDTYLVVAENGEKSQWVKNALASGTVDVWIAGRNRRGRVKVSGEDPEMVLKQYSSKIVSLMNRSLSSNPRAVEISLIEPARATG